jgi:hypothetical protein
VGCDIHAEILWEQFPGCPADPEKWWSFATLDLPRHYPVFGALAGVRSPDVDCEVPARGLPSGMYRGETYEERFGDHTYSWLTLEEFRRALDRVDALPGCEVPVEYRIAEKILEMLPRSIIVFGFDS